MKRITVSIAFLLLVLIGCADNEYISAPEAKHSEYKIVKTGDNEFFEYKIVYIEGHKFIMYQSSHGTFEIAGPLD